MAENTSGGEFIAGFLVGALVGAAAALMFAPHSGEETRTIIRDRGIELRDRADEISADARRRAEELQGQARTRAQDLQAQARDRAQGLQTRVRQAVEEGRAAANKRKEDLLTELDEEIPVE